MQPYTLSPPPQRRGSPAGLGPNLSPLDNVARLVRHDSQRLAREGQHGAGSLPLRNSSLRNREGRLGEVDPRRPAALELDRGGKGKERAVFQGELPGSRVSEPGSVVWGSADSQSQDADLQYAADTRPPRRLADEQKLSPIRQHNAFQGSIASTMLDSSLGDMSDDAESPVVPEHRLPPTRSALGVYPSTLAFPTHPSSQPFRSDSALSDNSVASNAIMGQGSIASAHTFGGAYPTIPSGHGPGRYGAPVLDNSNDMESLQGDRSTWYSDHDVRESFDVSHRPRESAMTMGSADGDPFGYSAYENFPSPTANRFHSELDAEPPSSPIKSNSGRPPPTQTPILRVGPPSPRTSTFPVDDAVLYHPPTDTPPSTGSKHAYEFLNEQPLDSYATYTPNASPFQSDYVPSSPTAGRTRSQTAVKNFSRPMQYTPQRSASLGSTAEDGGQQSSLGHESEAHSMSSSWEGRHQVETQHFANQRHYASLAQTAFEQESSTQDNRRDPSADSPAPMRPHVNAPPTPPTSPPRQLLQRPLLPFSQSDLGSSYRIDSYYASESIPVMPPPLFSPQRAEFPASSPQPPSPPRQRNVLRKPRPDMARGTTHPADDKAAGWGFLKGRRARKARESELTEDFGNLDGRLSDVPPMPPTVAFHDDTSNPTPPGVEGDRANRRTDERGLLMPDSTSRTARSPPERKWSDPEQFAHAEEVEHLDDQSHRNHMQRSASDIGPQRHQQRSGQSRNASSTSLYSDYSFYSLPPDGGNGSPNPNRSAQSSPGPSPVLRSQAQFSSTAEGAGPLRPMSTLEKAKAGMVKSRGGNGLQRSASGQLVPHREPETPDDYLQLGIDFHEEGELERAAWYFAQSAQWKGGCGGGMLMYGLTLRHGWGCQRNVELGFQYLQSAAESVVNDLDRVIAEGGGVIGSDYDTKAVKNELVLALYELGHSFRFGWGVAKDKGMAVSYFELAANLGDPDAQRDLAFCYANGKGCKKDMKKAAKYYRMAVAQGGESFGLSWIYKPKYM